MNQLKEQMIKWGKMLQNVFSKVDHKVKEKTKDKEGGEGWSLGDFVATVLRTMKLLWDVLLVFALAGLEQGLLLGMRLACLVPQKHRIQVSWFNRFGIYPVFQKSLMQMEA